MLITILFCDQLGPQLGAPDDVTVSQGEMEDDTLLIPVRKRRRVACLENNVEYASKFAVLFI